MSGIGDYIHWRVNRYRRFGIASGEDNIVLGTDFTMSYAAQKAILNNAIQARNSFGMNKEQAEKIAKYYTELFYGDLDKTITLSKNTNSDEKITATIREILFDWINTAGGGRLKSLLPKDIELIDQSLQTASTKLTERVEKVGTERVHISVLKKYVDSLKMAIKNSQLAFARNDKLQSTYASVDAVTTAGEKLKTAIENIIKQYGDAGDATLLSFKKHDGLKQVLDDAFTFLDYFRGNFGFAIAGRTSEFLLSLDDACNLCAIQETAKEAKTTLQEFQTAAQSSWKGATSDSGHLINTSIDYVDMDALLKQISEDNKSHFYKKSQLNAGSVEYSSNAAGTIDVILHKETINKILQDSGFNELAVSLKNYTDVSSSQSRGIHILSDTPLFNILTMYMETDFANHYLNLLGVSDEGIGQTLDGVPGQFEEATELLKYGIALRGLLGMDKNVDMLLINERAAKKVYVLTRADIASTLGEALTSRNIGKYIKFSSQLPKRGDGWNPWVTIGQKSDPEHEFLSKEGAKARITKFLAQMHAIKIGASILPAALTNIASYKK